MFLGLTFNLIGRNLEVIKKVAYKNVDGKLKLLIRVSQKSKNMQEGNKIQKDSLETIKRNAEVTRNTIEGLKEELSSLTNTYNKILAQQLMEENAKLAIAVEEAKKHLIQLEIANGIPQVPVPNQRNTSCSPHVEVEDKQKKAIDEEELNVALSRVNKEKIKKEKKPKDEKKSKEVATELPIDIGRLDLRIAKVEEVKRHPDADSLYVLKINCGEEKPRTVCSGLVKHVPMEELENRTVMLLCNLKPVKMRGIMSEAMVMCASSEQGVEVLIPPEGCVPGEPVTCEGYIRQPDPLMNPKKKIFETVAPDLHTNDSLEACYKSSPLIVAGKGTVLAKSLKNVPVK